MSPRSLLRYYVQMQSTSFSPVAIAERQALPLRPGCTVRVHQKIVDKGKTRIQVFEGVVIARKHGTEPGATFTVRRVGSDGIAVEKIFPLYSPMIDRIEVVRLALARRAKLYFLRDKTPRQIREKLRKTRPVPEVVVPVQEEAPVSEEPATPVDSESTSEETSAPVDVEQSSDSEAPASSETSEETTSSSEEKPEEKPVKKEDSSSSEEQSATEK